MDGWEGAHQHSLFLQTFTKKSCSCLKQIVRIRDYLPMYILFKTLTISILTDHLSKLGLDYQNI